MDTKSSSRKKRIAMNRIVKWERLLSCLIEARKNLEELRRLNREALGKEIS